MNLKNLLSYIKLFFVIIILGAILVTGFLFAVLERPTYSDSEKRALKEKPGFSFSSVFSGKYFSEYAEYYKDTVPVRENLKELGNTVLNMKGIAKDDIYIYKGGAGEDEIIIEDPFTPIPVITDEPVTPEPTPVPPTEDPARTLRPDETPTPLPTASPTPTPTPDPTPTPGPDEIIEENPGDGTLIYKDRAMQIYGGAKSCANTYIECLARLKTKMPELNVYNMTAPVSSAFYMPSKYKSNMTLQKNDIDYIRNNLSADIINVEVYSVLKNRVDENIYLKTDHHWSHLGCYYAMKEFAKAAGVPFNDISEYTEKTRSDYLGAFYYIYKMTQLKKYPETFRYYVSPVPHTCEYFDEKTMQKVNLGTNTLYCENLSTTYSYCICGYFDEYLSHAKTAAGTGRKLAIVKDSFGDPAPQFLLAGFDDIYLIDIRYFPLDIYDYFRENGITDVLCVSSIQNQFGSYARLYAKLFY